VYEIALSVSACLRAGTRVDVAWVVDAQGISARAKGEAQALAVTSTADAGSLREKTGTIH
jgi:hypothetical protein